MGTEGQQHLQVGLVSHIISSELGTSPYPIHLTLYSDCISVFTLVFSYPQYLT